MRITKKIISLLLVVSMLASFFAMSGFEASATLTGQQKTDFGLHFDDTTRKFKVLQLSDIQTDVGDSNISMETFKTVELAMKRYEPDLILLSGDQIQGGSTAGAISGVFGDSDMQDSLDNVFRTFTPYMKSTCKVVAVPGNHEYDYANLGDQWAYYNSQSWYLDWDNNFSTVDLNGEPGAGNVTVSAWSSDSAATNGKNGVALNIPMFNSKGDDEDGYLRPGGGDDAAYQQIVDWYKATNETLASSTYSYKAKVTGAGTAYVPAFGMQHVILQEIYNSFEESTLADGGTRRATDHDYRYLFNAEYIKFKDGLSYTGILGEGPCPSTLAEGSTYALYNALLEKGNWLGMCFGHDHLNTFDVTDANGFRFLMGGALTSENYNNGDPNVRYMEFTLDDATGEVTLESEIKSYSQMTASASTNVDEERIEAINGDGNQLINTLSVPKTIYIGHQDNNADPRKVQKKGTLVQEKLLDYETKNYYNQDLDVSYVVPKGASEPTLTVTRINTGTSVGLTEIGSEVLDAGTIDERTIYRWKIPTTLNIANGDGDSLLYTVKYTIGEEAYEIYNSSAVENIKMPAGYLDWFRTWRDDDTDTCYHDLHYVGTLSGANAYSDGTNDVITYNEGDWFVSNIHYDYSMPNLDIDNTWVNHHGDSFYSMYFWSPGRVKATEGQLAARDILEPARTDIYLDTSAMQPVSANDSRLDTGARIDFWLPQSQARGVMHFVAGIGFYAGKNMYQSSGATVDPNDGYANYWDAVSAENDSTGPTDSGTLDNATVFTYDSYAGQQSYAGLGTTHVNGNLLDANKIGNMIGDRVGYPLVVDSEEAAMALDGVGMTMFTGVRAKGATSEGSRQLSVAIAPYYLMFHAYDKGDLRDLTMGDLMTPRKWSDYPNADETLWNNYVEAYKNALICYAQTRTNDTKVKEEYSDLNSAIVALLNSNKGDPDYSKLVTGTQDVLDAIDVPPILYVNAVYGSSGTIQTTGYYTDTGITFSVPTGAKEVTLTVIDENDNAKTDGATVSTATSSNGTDYTAKVTGGTATANGAVYYRISYKLDHTVGGETETKEWVHYAASYVKDTPKTEGVWVSRTFRDRSTFTGINSHIHIKNTLSIDSSVLGARGVSGIISLWGYQGDSFDQNTTVKNVALDGFDPGYGWNKVYMAVGSAQAWPSSAYWSGADGSNTGDNFSGLLADNRVVFVADRDKYSSDGDPVYWNGLKPVSDKVSNAGYENSNTPQSSEYIVANIYYDPQATGAKTVKPKIKYQLTNYDGDNQSPTVYKNWFGGTNGDYTTKTYGGDYTTTSPNVSSTGMFVLESTGSNTDWSGTGSVTMSNGTTYETYLTASDFLSNFTSTTTRSRLIIHAEKYGMKQVLVKYYAWNNSTVGFGFVFNNVDKSQAHKAIDAARTAKVCKEEMGESWWADYRSRLFAAYVDCGNLWTTEAYKDNVTEKLSKLEYASANYDVMNALINEITGAGLETGVKEHIESYDAIEYAVNSGDDDRYENQSFQRTMYLNNATALINTLKNRTAVYKSVDSQQADATEANKNLHDAHLDMGYQKYIDAYVEEIRAAWNNLRLAEADYTAFNKYVNYYNEANDTILFMRNEYAGYNNDGTARNYANEKALQSGMFTAKTYNAFKTAVSVEQNLKKPSEKMALDILNSNGVKTGSLDRIYPDKYTYKNVTEPDIPDTTVCLYNTARDAYEALEFRRAGEYYQANGQWSETYTDADGKTVTVTYSANYNKQDRGSSYYYTPVFTTNINKLTADIENAGYVVTDAKVNPRYTAGNEGDKDGNGTNLVYEKDENGEYKKDENGNYIVARDDDGNVIYAEDEIWVLNGAGAPVKAIPPWTEASWGGANYGFKNAYEENISGTASTYQTTKGNTEQNPWILALFVEAEILPDIALVDYYYDHLVPASYDMSQLEIQQNSYAEYEKGGSGYANLESYVIYDENGVQLTDGAQWYTADTWAEYQATKVAQPGIIDGATLAENQNAINALTQAIYQNRNALKLRTMDDYRVNGENAILGKTTFAEINEAAGVYNTEIANKIVKVFKSAYDAPQTLDDVKNNALNFKDHPYYADGFRTNVAAAYAAIQGYSGKPMATNITNYKPAIDNFVALYETRGSNLNGADYSGLTMLLNKTWIPDYEKYGKFNVVKPNTTPVDYFTGDKWYTAETWSEYVTARDNAAKFYKDQVAYNLEYGNAQDYGTYNAETNPDGILTGGLLVDSQGMDGDKGSVTVEGSINKATYDLLVAYYKLVPIKVSESTDDTNGSYNDIIAAATEKLNNIKTATVNVLMVDADGELYTDTRYTYKQDYVEEVQAAYNTITALASNDYALKYQDYLNAVNSFNTLTSESMMNQKAALVYMDGWNSLYAYLQKNATVKDEKGNDVVVHTINSIDSLNKYFENVYGSIDGINVYTLGDYNGDGVSIEQVQMRLGWIDPAFNTAKQAQTNVNTYLQELYEDLTSEKAVKVPAMIRDAISDAQAKISDVGTVAYDPYQINRDKVTGISKYTDGSKNILRNVVIVDNNKAIKFWDAKISETGYLSNVEGSEKVVIDGTYADNIWAAAGLTTESGIVYPEDETKVDNPRYVLKKGGRFLDALKDAITYAEVALYKNTEIKETDENGKEIVTYKFELKDGNKIIKDFTVLKGDGTVDYTAEIFTAESIKELTDALAAGYAILAETEGSYTDQTGIDIAVFNILEESDIGNTINLVVSEEDDSLYASDGKLGHVANDYGLKYKPADLTYLNEELAAKYSKENMSESTQGLIDEVWGTLKDDGTYDLVNKTGYTYFTETTWKAYSEIAYTNARSIKNSNATLTAADQADVNNSAIAVYSARNALEWNTIDSHVRWQDAQVIGGYIMEIEKQKAPVNVYTNSVILEDGVTLTAPSSGSVLVSEYGQKAIDDITAMWQAFQDKYPKGSEYANYVDMIADYEKLNAAYTTLKAEPMDYNSGFAQGAKDLIDNFIAGEYNFTTGEYVASYLTVAEGTEFSDAERAVRETQYNIIKGYLDEIRALLNGKNTINDPSKYSDSEGKPLTYLEALNDITMKLYEYVTTTRAQYAGFALDMRQNMLDYFNTTINVTVDTKKSATSPVYTKEVRIFPADEVEVRMSTINLAISDPAIWPTINQIDDSVGISKLITETINPNEVEYTYTVMDENGNPQEVYVDSFKNILLQVGAYSKQYEYILQNANAHSLGHVEWLTEEAVFEGRGRITYILADPGEFPVIDGATFAYSMDADERYDGNWYTVGYGEVVSGSQYEKYYIAESKEDVTGSETGGWFTISSYSDLTTQLGVAETTISNLTGDDGSYKLYGATGTTADAIHQTFTKISRVGTCWSAENREAFVAAVQADQAAIDNVAKVTYEKIIDLKLLPATDAYREVASLIYAAMGKVPTYIDDDTTGVIIEDGTGELADYMIGENVCGRIFNNALLTQLGEEDKDYFESPEGSGIYYAPGLPAGYDGGEEAVEEILNILQEKLGKPVTIDKEKLVNDTTDDEITSVKEEILNELEKLTLGLADLSAITSLTAAFLYNNPNNDGTLGTYGEDFFAEHVALGNSGNASRYKTDLLIMSAGDMYHESGFYDFSKYTKDSLNAVNDYLWKNGIISTDTYNSAVNFDLDEKTGFDIVFTADIGSTLYQTPKTQQDKIVEIYAGLVNVINNLELRPAGTKNLNEKLIPEANDIKINKELYDFESEEGKAAWDEFINASQNAESYSNATIINEKQVGEAEEALARAIKALKLNVDNYAPVVTIHNTQNDLTEFRAAHPELADTIKANEMIAPSYMETGLGNYTLYVYTNQINPHIVVSLEDTLKAKNTDGTLRDVKASKPEKMTVTAHAMSGVTASVIKPVLDETNGSAIATQSVAIAGENATAGIESVSTQTAKTLVKDDAGNEVYKYAANSSAYVVLNPSFEGVADGAQSAVKYSIHATDSAVEKVNNEDGTQSIVPKENTASSLDYATGSNAAEEITGDITIFVYYMNAMPEDGNDNGVVGNTVNASAVLTTHERNGIAADKWTNSAMLYRIFAKPVRSWEFSETPAQLEAKFNETGEVATYYDPTFGENNFGSFVYVLDPNATKGSLDYNVAETFFTNGSDAAKAAFINALSSNTAYIAQFNDYVKSGSTTGVYGYKHYGANDINGQYENWMKPMGNIPNGALVFIHVADRFGNVCNRLVEWKNYDPIAPVLSTSEAGKVSVTEPGGSGVAKVDLFKDMGTFDSSLYLGDLYGLLHIEGVTYAAEGNEFTIDAGKENANKHFTVAVTDKAGNVKSIPVNTDADGKIVITVTQTFDNFANYNAKPASDVTTESGEDLEVIEFVFNGESTVLLNYIEPTSIVKAGPDGNVFANRDDEPLNIIAKAEVESIKLYNVVTGTEEIWTTANAEVTENDDGTNTWTVYRTFTEGEHSYKATAKVNGEWEVSSVDFNFVATTKTIIVKVINIGIGRTMFCYNDGDVSKIATMSVKEVPYGSVVKIDANPTVESSKFYYWKNDYSDRIVSAADIMEFVAVTNMEFTAQFTTNEVFKNDKKLVVYVNNAENVVDSFELADGEDYKVPAAPSLAEHVFKSWNMTKDEVLASEEKMIIVRPVYSLVVKNTVTLTEGNWTATGAGEYESVGDERALATISASATNEAGAGFLYWLDAETGDVASYNRTYTFHVIKDTELTPVYGDASAVLPVPVARIATIKYDDKADKVSFYAERSVPAGYTMIQTGIVVTKSASVANNEAAFILDASGVSKGTSKSMASSGFYSASVSATSGVTVYARAYMIYANADGDIINYYSPVSSFTA